MKAAVLEEQGKGVVIRDDVKIQAPGPGQVRVRVCNCGVCHSDLSVIDGAFPAALPVILGHEAAGVVEELGPGVESLAEGDHVVLTPCPPCGTCYFCLRGDSSVCVRTAGLISNTFVDGTTGLSIGDQTVYRGLNVAAFAENVVADANGAVKIPSDVPLDVACVIGCAVQTGVGAVLNTAQVEEGATVLVLGLGGIGLSVVQGARLAGAARIVVSDPVAERRDSARALGATDFIDPTTEDVLARGMEITGVGFDYAFEAAGRSALLETGLAAIRNGGTLVCVGAPPLEELFTLMPAAFVITGKKILSTVLGGANSLRDIPRYIALWQNGRLDLDALITGRRPLSEINGALEDLRTSRGIRTVLDIS
ncbi:MAG: Zn-dependent alcohol dehydrogenase [Candidatus Binatia bacterium]|nr:Zn-dependent alcohol dehydrogenase [Candidatus Binatia bacterium]